MKDNQCFWPDKERNDYKKKKNSKTRDRLRCGSAGLKSGWLHTRLYPHQDIKTNKQAKLGMAVHVCNSGIQEGETRG